MIIRKINIPEPCHQPWQQMATVSGGRHCESCSKTVVDFTKMNNDEIINYLSANNRVCGRVHQQQMHGINIQLASRRQQSKGGWARWVIAAGIFAGTIYNRANAQSCTHPTEQTASTNKQKAGDTSTSDSVKYRTISGIVLAEDNLPLPGVTIVTDQGNIGTHTDDHGRFNIRVPVLTKKLIIRFIGYEKKEVKLKKIKVHTIELKMQPTVNGGFVITRSFSIRQLYASLVKMPALRKLNKEI